MQQQEEERLEKEGKQKNTYARTWDVPAEEGYVKHPNNWSISFIAKMASDARAWSKAAGAASGAAGHESAASLVESELSAAQHSRAELLRARAKMEYVQAAVGWLPPCCMAHPPAPAPCSTQP